MLTSFRPTFPSSALLSASGQLCRPVPRELGTAYHMLVSSLQVLISPESLAMKRRWKSFLSAMSSFPFIEKV